MEEGERKLIYEVENFKTTKGDFDLGRKKRGAREPGTEKDWESESFWKVAFVWIL
jgi:hypothetical protein